MTSMAQNWQHFSTSALDVVSKSEIALVNETILAREEWASGFKTLITQSLTSLTQKSFEIAFGSMHRASPDELKEIFANNACIAIFSRPSHHTHFALAINFQLAIEVIYNFLGSAKASSPNKQFLSAVEQGLFSYLLIQLLQATAKTYSVNLGQIVLSKLISSPDEVSEYLADDNLVNYEFTTSYDGSKSFVNIITNFNGLGANSALLSTSTKVKGTPLSNKALAIIELPIVCSIPLAMLQTQELADLKIDDVIIFGEGSTNYYENGLAGEVNCLLGEDRTARTVGYLVPGNNRHYQVKIGIFAATLPPQLVTPQSAQDFDMNTDDLEHEEFTQANMAAFSADDELEESDSVDAVSQDLINEIPQALSVEIGRVNLNISALMQLKRGAIIELNRGPRDLVDIVVGGIKIGRGELVNIDGELGLRIASLQHR